MLRQMMITLLTVAALATAVAAADDLEQGFAQPPASARPWVYWFPLSGNLTKEGITADLEAMQRAGIGGVLYMEVDQGAPKGPADFAGPLWRELFQHACREADRLGLQLNINNDAGWCGSGGPWITPEMSMQRVVWTETVVEGPTRFDGTLAKPPAVRDFYRDIAVLAMPAPDAKARIPNIQGKASFKVRHFPPQPAHFRSLPADAVIPHKRIVELTAEMSPDGKLAWDVPPGQWLILRLGHTTTGKDNHPAPESGRGLECDKFSKAAAETHFNALVGRLIAENQPLAGQGKVFVSTHVDSWEVGSQNWTPRMRQEFQKRRGYDLWPFLPVFTGRVVDSLEVSERFLWDLRQTVSDLIVENYAGHLRTLANRHGLRLSIEAYGEPADDMTYAGRADEPMSEFWSWSKFGAAASCTEMASAAHTYGKRILGAEAFTATNTEKWQGYPGNIKDLGDWAFCEGVNRFVFHRYAAQPWTNRSPGMSMGPWGLHYERTQTWWQQSKAWHEYLARCQYLLQQGLFVADVCYLQPEGAPRRFVPPPATSVAPYTRGGYNFDGCTPEVVLTRMHVADGRIVLPDGMSYRVLVLPQVETMTPALLGKVGELIRAGATVFAPSRAEKSPGLSNYPACDAQVRQLAGEIWGDGPAPAELTERRLGRGRLIWGGRLSPKPTAESDGPPRLDRAQWIWRKEGNPAAAVPPGTRYFRRLVTLDDDSRIQSARLAMTADNAFECWVNGRRVGAGDRFDRLYLMNVAPALKPGTNVVAVAATNGAEAPNPAGLIGLLTIRLQDGRKLEVATDKSWEAARKVAGDWRSATAADGWATAMELGPCGMAPWGEPEFMPPVRDVFPDATVIHAWLTGAGVPPDFNAAHPLRYIHRRIGDADVYFVANGSDQRFQTTCTFRVAGKQPELWHPETGRIAALPFYHERNGCTDVLLDFGPTESVFIVFRRPGRAADRLVSVRRDGRELLRLDPPATSPNARAITNSFTIVAWVKPDADTLLPPESSEGVTAYTAGRNDVLFPPPGHEVWGEGDAGVGFAVGRNGICVHEHGADHFPAVLVYPAPITGWTHVAVVYRDGVPSLYVGGKLVRTGLKSRFVVHPGVRVPHTRPVAPFQGQRAGLRQFDHALGGAEIAELAKAVPNPAAAGDEPVVDLVRGEIHQPGTYVLTTADGRSRQIKVADLPAPVEISGPWEVGFDPRWGGPEKVTFDKLEDWSKRPEDGIRFYSGTAVYRKTLHLDPAIERASTEGGSPTAGPGRVYLDLGNVAVMAQVKLNGKDLGVLWKPPYRVDLTDAAKAGENTLEIDVVNLWINRQIGDEQLPEDSDRNPNGTLKRWPDWLIEGKPSPTGRFTFTSWRLWKKDDPLQPSGLLGPVTLQTAVRFNPQP